MTAMHRPQGRELHGPADGRATDAPFADQGLRTQGDVARADGSRGAKT